MKRRGADDPRLDYRLGLFRFDDTRQGQFLEHGHRRIVGGKVTQLDVAPFRVGTPSGRAYSAASARRAGPNSPASEPPMKSSHKSRATESRICLGGLFM